MTLNYNIRRILCKTNNYYEPFVHLFAEVNKTPLTYLNSLPQRVRNVSNRYRYHVSRLKRILEVASEVSKIIEENKLKCVIFKTIPPFMEAIADVDIICIDDYWNAIKIFTRYGFKIMESYWYCTTLEDYKTNFSPDPVMVDIYNYITIGGFIYLNKYNLINHIQKAKLIEIAPWAESIISFDQNSYIYTLDPIAEFIALVAHSVFKEREYLLRDYMIVKAYSKIGKNKFLEELVRLIYENKLTRAFVLYLSISYIIAKYLDDKGTLEFILNIIEKMNTKTLNKIILDELPYKYDYNLMLYVMMEKITDKEALRSIPLALSNVKYKTFLIRLFSGVIK